MTTSRPLTWLRLSLAMSLIVCSPGGVTNRPVKLRVDVSRPAPEKTVSAACSLDPALSPLDTVDALRLYGSKPERKKHDLHILASVDRWDPNPRLFSSLSAGSADLTGFFGFDSNKSELSLTWTLPAQTTVFRYKCAAEGTDSNGQGVILSELAEVASTESYPDQECLDRNVDTCKLADIVADLAKASIDVGECLEERTVKFEKKLSMGKENTDNLQEKIENFAEDIGESVENSTVKIENKLNTVKENIDNLKEKVEDIAHINIQSKLRELETTAAQNMKTITSFFRELQDTMGKLQQSLATQASAIRILEARPKFDVSGEFRGKRYLVSKLEKFKIGPADVSCTEFGGYLAEIDDRPELDFVMEFLKSLGMNTYYAVGLNDASIEGDFQFYHSQKTATYQPWASEEPNNYRGNEDCASINPARGGYVDIPCDFEAKHICEVLA